MYSVLAFFLVPAVTLVADFSLLSGDDPLNHEEIVAMTQRPLLEFYEGGQSVYLEDGSYRYTYQKGGTAHGRYEIESDGVICVSFENGRARCDQFVHSHGRLVMLTQSGDRYPIRP